MGLGKGKYRQQIKKFIELMQTRIQQSEMGVTSSVVAYYLLLSFFPLLIAIGNILPLLHIDQAQVLSMIKTMIPNQIYILFVPAIKTLLTNGSKELLSISAVATLWSASKSINALQIAMNKAYGVTRTTNYFVMRFISMLMLVLFFCAIIGVMVVIGFGKVILDGIQPFLEIPDSIITTFQTVKWPLTATILLTILTLIYWMVPNAKIGIRSAFPGAVLATVGWLALTQVFGIYMKYFATSFNGYKIIGTFMVLMIWLKFAAMVIVFCGVVNTVIAEYRSGGDLRQRRDPIELLTQRIKARLLHSNDEESESL